MHRFIFCLQFLFCFSESFKVFFIVSEIERFRTECESFAWVLKLMFLGSYDLFLISSVDIRNFSRVSVI